MKNIINKLIKNHDWTGIDSIVFADGKMTLLDVNFYSDNSYFISPIADSTIESYLDYNSDYLSSFDVFSNAKYQNYEVLVGDGSGEGNGVIYVLNNGDNSLIWFAFFENSEPFKKVSVDEEGFIYAVSEVNITWKINIKDPLNIKLIYPKDT